MHLYQVPVDVYDATGAALTLAFGLEEPGCDKK